VTVGIVTTRSQADSELLVSGELPAPATTSNSGEKVRELSVSNRVDSMIDYLIGGEQQCINSKFMLQDYKKFKHGKEVNRNLKFNTVNRIYWHKLSCIISMLYTRHMIC
jgi:hypothetical protein